jgi:hypothetical protein
LAPLSALPPLTHMCGSAGASGCVYKIEYQGKVAAAKKFHPHMWRQQQADSLTHPLTQ